MSKIAQLGISSSKCGYCKSKQSKDQAAIDEHISDEEGGFICRGYWAQSILPKDYQMLLDHGCRRSGEHYIYQPIPDLMCCRPFSIRLKVDEFVPTKSQKKSIRRFINHFCGNHLHPDEPDIMIRLQKCMDSSEQLDIVLEKSSYKEEAYELYKKYQLAIHHDKPEKLTREQYEDFLVKNSFDTNAPYQGAFHLSWYFHGQLIAVGVLDILPKCLSSVYFFYDPDLSKWSLGTLSALVEINLAGWLSSHVIGLKYYYLGLYIDDCPKLNYKANFGPSQILDPVQYEWIPFEEAKGSLF